MFFLLKVQCLHPLIREVFRNCRRTVADSGQFGNSVNVLAGGRVNPIAMVGAYWQSEILGRPRFVTHECILKKKQKTSLSREDHMSTTML